MRMALALVLLAACSKDDRPAPPESAPAPEPAPPAPPAPAVSAPPPFLVVDGAEVVSRDPLRWERDGRLWERSVDPRKPRDLGERKALVSAVFDDDHWYTTRCTSDCGISHGKEHTLSRISRRDGTSTDLATERSGGDNFTGLRLDGARLVWGSFSGYGERGAVSRVHRDGGPVETLWKDSAIAGFELHPDGILAWSLSSVAWIPEGQPAQVLAAGLAQPSVAVDATHVYLAELGESSGKSPGRIVRLPRAGGPLELVAAPVQRPRGVAVDDQHVYWIVEDQRAVFAAPKGGGGLRRIELPPPSPAEDCCVRTVGLWGGPTGLHLQRGGSGDCGDTLYFVPTR